MGKITDQVRKKSLEGSILRNLTCNVLTGLRGELWPEGPWEYQGNLSPESFEKRVFLEKKLNHKEYFRINCRDLIMDQVLYDLWHYY